MTDAGTIERASISFRPQTPEDSAFLVALYASTRAEEMKLVPWTPEQKDAFLRMQFDAQTAHYENYYSSCAFLVIEREGSPIGRLYIDRREDEIHIIDIALLPDRRGAGIGTMLLREILHEAAETSKPVTIHVEHFNPARHLYDRLGFRHIDTNGVYHLMEWRSS
ncbi:MAG: GNAT family N-acetyltransferase [Thermoanaerobaculia bacterium]